MYCILCTYLSNQIYLNLDTTFRRCAWCKSDKECRKDTTGGGCQSIKNGDKSCVCKGTLCNSAVDLVGSIFAKILLACFFILHV